MKLEPLLASSDLATGSNEAPRFGWGLRHTRLNDGTLVPELVPVKLTPEAKRKHRPTGRKRGRSEGAPGAKNANGWSDYRDWHIARIVDGGMALGLGYETSIGMAAMDVHTDVRTIERALRRIRAAERASSARRANAGPIRVGPRFKNMPLVSLDPPMGAEEIWRLHRRFDKPE